MVALRRVEDLLPGDTVSPVNFDPDLPPDGPHNSHAARVRGLVYDRDRRVYRDRDGLPARDRFGQPIG